MRHFWELTSEKLEQKIDTSTNKYPHGDLNNDLISEISPLTSSILTYVDYIIDNTRVSDHKSLRNEHILGAN
jgi:hypothetical protein